ncbi:MAG: hypothetical protein FWG79_03530 [Bacteroidales bacterium]|nr:hypothetical protein [Bacteroidales bacterium]
MKRFAFIGLLIGCFLQGSAQTRPIAETELPVAIFEGFELAYPDLPQRTWEQRNTRFVATIKYEDRTELATFLETGEWAETRYDVDRSTLPESINPFINSRYNAYRIQSTQYVEENSGGIYYEVLLVLRSNRNLSTELIFDMGGDIQMVDGLPVYESADGHIVAKDDENKRIKPGIQREIIDENKGIPEIVLTNLRRRYGAIDKIEWTKTDLGFHRGAFRFRDVNIATEWDDEGNQASVITFFNKRNATHLIQKFLDDNYPRARFISGERVVYETRFTRMFPDLGLRSYFIVEISDRPRGARETIFYTIYFDQTGQLDMIVQKEDSTQTE